MSNKINKTQAMLVLEAVFNTFDQVQKKNAEREALKSPEQKALEARQLVLKRDTDQRERLNKQYMRFDKLFNDWLKHDSWLIYDEAMPLIKGETPEGESILNPRDSDLWDLVQSCANHSLKIINPEAKPKLWKVKPFEWVRWLKEKDQSVHTQLKELVLPKALTPIDSNTLAATKNREKVKAERIRAIKTFSQNAGELARKQNITWNDQEIPVTKSDFLDVFCKLYTAFKKVGIASFDRDFAEIGIKFKRGTKNNKNNMLKKIFSIN